MAERVAGPASSASKPALESASVGPLPKGPGRTEPTYSFGLQSLSINQVALLSILSIFLLHLAALTLFTQGFLLKRTTLETRNTCDLNDFTTCTLPAKYDRAVILLVDALRWDFLFPRKGDALDFDATHHNHLTVPVQLAREQPTHSLLYKAIADPPTTTLQRLKAITTGSLPTFVDAGSNFAGSRVDEDNWLEQANRAGKRIAFMGDDTWLTIFPEDIFAPNLSFPFDSFHVEDLDTVDAGVRQHVLPLMDQTPDDSSWDVLVAHPLGLDHAGHRFGASHAETTRKLREVNRLIADIVDRLSEKDLLVVMGDHGMDAKGDHGGDSPDETDAGLWMYSKTPLVPSNWLASPPSGPAHESMRELLHKVGQSATAMPSFFISDEAEQRQVQQISLVPTLSLLLGFAIPYNNLGSIIPELFMAEAGRSTRWVRNSVPEPLQTAIEINARQLRTYLEGYASQSGGQDLAPFVPDLLKLHDKASTADSGTVPLSEYVYFMNTALDTTRGIWARFDPASMTAGLVLLLISLLACVRFYGLTKLDAALREHGPVRRALARGSIGLLAGLAPAIAVSVASAMYGQHHVPLSTATIFFSGFGAAAGIVTTSANESGSSLASGFEKWLTGMIIGGHGIGFASNSFILWEDTVTLVLLQLPVMLMLFKATHAPERRLRMRIAGFATVALITSRLSALSSVCREEQHPYCTATFYGSSGTSIASPSAILAAVIAAVATPYMIGAYLDITRSRQGWAPFLLSYTFRAALVGGALFWAADYMEQTGNDDQRHLYSTFKSVSAKLLMLFSILLATTFWAASPVCIDIEQESRKDQTGQVTTQIKVIGFANAIGSSYLLFYLAIFALIFLVAQPIGQVVMAAGLIGFLAFLEANDGARDSTITKRAFENAAKKRAVQSSPLPPPTMLSICYLVLFGFVQFFATGHQAVLSSIQWKTAFVGFPKLTYPFSPILVVLNTIGPFILSAAALPLLVFWNTAPTRRDGPTLPLLSSLLVASFGFLAYHTALTLSSALFAAHLRRHLMVWKVFAPRFMLSALTLLVVDATVLVVAVGWGGIGTLGKLHRSLGTRWS